MAFDPSQPYELLDAPAPASTPPASTGFDPSKPFAYEPVPGAEAAILAAAPPREQTATSTTAGAPVVSTGGGGFDSLVATLAESQPSGRDIAATLPTALRVGAPIAGAALAPVTFGASLPAAAGLAAAGGLAAELLAQPIEKAVGDRAAYSPAEGAVNVAFAPLAAIGVPFANSPTASLATKIAQAGVRGLEGAAINTGQGAALRAARGQEQTGDALLLDAAIGFGLGSVIGTAADAYVRGQRLNRVMGAAREAGFEGQTTDDLTRWIDAQRAARARNVTPDAAAPRPGNPANVPPPPATLPRLDLAGPFDAPVPAAVPRELARLAGGLRPAELPAPPAPLALPNTPRLALPAPSAAVETAPAPTAAPDNRSPDMPAPTAAAPAFDPAQPFEVLPPTAQPAPGLPAPVSAPELAPATPDAASGAVGEGGGAASLPGATDAAPAPAAGKFAKVFEGRRDAELRQRAKQIADALARPGMPARRRALLQEEAAAIPAELYARKQVRRAAGNTGRGFGIAPLPDGSLDLLNAIDDAGGVHGPRPGETGGEYDGFRETFGSGMPKLLVRRNAQAIDQLIAELNDQGYNFATPDDFRAAVAQAVQTRTRARQEFERQMQTDTFQKAALENRSRGKGEAAGAPVPVQDLRTGDKFKIKGEPFEVVDFDPDTLDAIVQDGPRFGTQTLPGSTSFYPDKRSLRRVPRAEADQWPVGFGDQAADVSPAPAPSLPAPGGVTTPEPGAAAPALVPAGQNLEMFTGGDTGGDTTFNLAGETVQDFTGFMDARAQAQADRAAAERAQGGLFSTKLGIAAGADKFAAVQRMLDPQSVLPEEFRRAVRFGQQGEAAILTRAKAIQADLRRALDSARKASPGVDAATFAYMTGGQPLAALPAAVRFPAQQARQFIDSLSDRAIREGVITGQLAQTFADNLGTYLRRSYRLFADPQWFPDQAVRDRAAAYIMANWNPKRALSRREADTVIGQLLDRPSASQFMIGGKIAGRDVSSLVARQDLAPEIRALYGEITDPLEAFGQTVPRLAKLIEQHHAQQWIRLAGLRTGLFTTAPSPLNTRELVSDSNKPHEVWRGLYTTPEVAEAMQREATMSGRALSVGEVVGNTIRTFTGLAKLGKTVLNPDSYAPNILGGLVSMAANGNFNLLPGGRGLLLAAEDLGLLRAAGVAPQSRTALQQDIEKLTRLGLRGEGISAADLLQTWERSLLPAMTGKAKRLVQPWLRGYGAIDDTTKYLAWKSELARLRSWQPGAPLATLEREAAERVRATMPTYSQIPKWVRQASQLGIAPSFVSFTYEVFRNTANSARIGARDLADGLRTGNSAQARDGARRLAALLAVLAASSGAGLAALSRRENKVTDDQDEAVRFFGPKWNENGMLMYNRPVAGGTAQYSNISYLLPHALVFEALEAGTRGETGEEQARRFMSALGTQFLAADGGVFLGPAIEAYVGVSRDTGRPIVNRESPTPTADALGYVADRALTPAAVAKTERMIKAAREEQGPFGRVYSLSEEGWRLAGVRAQSMDFNQAAEFKARDLARRWTDATNLYRTMQGRNVPEADLEAAYARSEAARQNVHAELAKYLRYGRVAGVPEDNLVKNLRTASGLGAEEILGLLDGRYVPGTREKRESGAALLERVAKLPQDQIAAELVQAITADPKLARSLQREVETLAKGITQTDRLVLALDVADGSRARWVAGQLASGRVAPSEAGAWLTEQRRKGIITDSVRKQLETGSWQQMAE